jgi:endonuclease III
MVLISFLLARPHPPRPRPLRRLLLAWYRRNSRPLPWRGTRDPYRIWVSEAMLQQTRVATVRSYYNSFLTRFPTLEALAQARLEEVLTVWSGLGYYRRARHLHDAARIVVRDHEGRVPDDPLTFGRLPGVGRYTTGAVLSLAFDRSLAVLDGNVARVLSRLFALRAAVRGAARRARRLGAGRLARRGVERASGTRRSSELVPWCASGARARTPARCGPGRRARRTAWACSRPRSRGVPRPDAARCGAHRSAAAACWRRGARVRC